ncbi:hypothetical protein [Mucilaginibacter paludis]|uniref:Uncharacterized protein n=1 Tax=Mucilaginibacter paludis DSM 18603 TaxID=714943 RepID=H1YBV6_9SPHI|nr:hypothetical protein [Mucilaginibacter paludis]EHQ27034.1 hypothetical protein Mucpa_2926 [Mucilaginibacter paludis DSM 18603]
MPIFRITVKLCNGRGQTVLRMWWDDLNLAYNVVRKRVHTYYGSENVCTFDMVMLCEHSREYQDFEHHIRNNLRYRVSSVFDLPPLTKKHIAAPRPAESSDTKVLRLPGRN